MNAALITAADVADDMSWLFDEAPELDPDISTWEEFLKLDMTGWSVNFGCHGGDMDELTGIIERVYKDGDSIKIRLKNAEIAPEDPDERERVGIIEKFYKVTVELETCWPPIIRPGMIIIDSGLCHIPGWDLGSGFDAGFISQR